MSRMARITSNRGPLSMPGSVGFGGVCHRLVLFVVVAPDMLRGVDWVANPLAVVASSIIPNPTTPGIVARARRAPGCGGRLAFVLGGNVVAGSDVFGWPAISAPAPKT